MMKAAQSCRRNLAICAIWGAISLAACASPPNRESNALAGAPRPAATAAPKASVPTDGKSAFVDGYQSFKRHDTARAITQLQFAAANYPALGDYALFYLGLAEQESGDLSAAADSLLRLEQSYPRSVMLPRGGVELAGILLKLGRNDEAAAAASRVLVRSPEGEVEQGARIAEARALVALKNPKAAYEQAMIVRDRNPHSDLDEQAREIAYSILAANPDVTRKDSLEYHRNESALLLREGDLGAAAAQARAGLAMASKPADRAELLWALARGLKPEPAQAKQAILQCLRAAPHGQYAPDATERLALIYWHDDQFEQARNTFSKLAATFPSSSLAPGAMLRVGRIWEEQNQLAKARAQYRRLAARYSSTVAGADARFRACWMLYRTHDYKGAAAGFLAARAHAADGAERDMFDYWRGRALEKSGDSTAAHAIFAQVALSIESNYYPALASRVAGGAAPDLPAASEPMPSFEGVPGSASPTVQFHLQRLDALRLLGLKDLQVDELHALAAEAGDSPAMRSFVLAGFAIADAWYDGIVAATRMEKSGLLSHAAAERIRYPRAYWDLIEQAGARHSLDPYLVLALARQESLFNPEATSSSNARGLMQLIPSTAAKVAAENNMNSAQVELYDPSVNVALGTAYLQSLFTMFGGDEFRAVAAYNAGEHAVAKWSAEFSGDSDEWVEDIQYSETRDYVKKVIGGRREYLLLYRPDSSKPAA